MIKMTTIFLRKNDYQFKNKSYRLLPVNIQFLLLILTLLLSACGTIKPEPPKSIEKEKAQEIFTSSTINLPVKINIKQFEPLLNKGVPVELYKETGMDVGHGITMDLEVRRDGNITLETVNGRINTCIPLYIKGRANWKAEANVNQKLGSVNLNFNVYKIDKSQDFDTKIIFKTSTLINVDKSWTLNAQTDSDFQLSQAPYIEILGFKITFGKIAADNIKSQLPMINSQINKQIKDMYDLKTEIRKNWNLLRNPILFSDNPVKVWGIFEPESFNFAPPASPDNKTLLLNFSLTTKIKSYIGENPPKPANGDLIPLKNDKMAKSDFNLNLPVFIELKAFEKIAKDNLLNKEFDIPNTNRKVLVKDLTLYGMGDIVVCKLNIESKKTKGEIYLTSKLGYNPDTKVLFIKDLDFDVNTSNLLYNKASWLVNKLFLSYIEKNLTYNTGDMLEKARIETEKAINNTKINEMITITGKVNKLFIDNISTETDFVKVNTNISGSLNVDIK